MNSIMFKLNNGNELLIAKSNNTFLDDFIYVEESTDDGKIISHRTINTDMFMNAIFGKDF